MSFISNIFLWLLPLISIPLIIHLLNRRKIIQINFSSILFLESLKSDSIRRINILQWLLLIIRTIIVLLIILMMSRPILKGYFPQIKIDPNSSLSIIVLDDSFSLNGKVGNYRRIDLINEKYNEILKSLDEESQICVISLSQGILYEGINSNLPDLSKLFSISNKHGELYKYINIINQKFSESIINKEIFIITDGQATLFNNLSHDLMEEWIVYFILIDEMKSNLKINYARIKGDILVKDKLCEIEAEIENNGSEKVENNMVNLFLNNINVGLQNISINAGEKKIVSFSTVFPDYRDNLVQISISEDDNNADNHYYINAYIPDELKILSVFNDLNATKYVSNVINTINKKSEVLNHSAIQYLDLSYSDLANHDIVIIYDYKIIEYHYNYFEQYLSSNKHLIVFPAINNNSNELYGIEGFGSDGSYIYLENDNYEKILYSDLLSNDISKINSNEDFIKVSKYIEVPLNTNTMVPMGEQNSFWDKTHFDNSRLDIFYSSFHLKWNEFPLKGFFIQFLYELFYSGFPRSSYNKFVEDELLLPINTQSIVKSLSHTLPTGEVLYLSPAFGKLYTDDIMLPGIHRFYNNDNLLYLVATNIDSAELSSPILETSKIEKIMGSKCYFFKSNDKISTSIINNREGYEVWRYLLLLLCFMIIIEMLISNVSRET